MYRHCPLKNSTLFQLQNYLISTRNLPDINSKPALFQLQTYLVSTINLAQNRPKPAPNHGRATRPGPDAGPCLGQVRDLAPLVAVDEEHRPKVAEPWASGGYLEVRGTYNWLYIDDNNWLYINYDSWLYSNYNSLIRSTSRLSQLLTGL